MVDSALGFLQATASQWMSVCLCVLSKLLKLHLYASFFMVLFNWFFSINHLLVPVMPVKRVHMYQSRQVTTKYTPSTLHQPAGWHSSDIATTCISNYQPKLSVSKSICHHLTTHPCTSFCVRLRPDSMTEVQEALPQQTCNRSHINNLKFSSSRVSKKGKRHKWNSL